MNQHAHDNEDVGLEVEASRNRRFRSAGLAGSAADRMAEITGSRWEHVFCPTRPGNVTFRIQEVSNAKL